MGSRYGYNHIHGGKKYMKVGLVTLHYKNIEDTLGLLESLSKCIKPKDFEFKLYIIDNSNEVDFENKLAIFKVPFKLITNKQNTGFTGGNNLGFQKALDDGMDYIGTINNDTYVDKNFLKAITQSPLTDPTVGLVGGLIYFAPGFEFHKKYKKSEFGKVIWYAGGIFDYGNVLGSHSMVDLIDSGDLTETFNTQFITGCFFIARREIFEKHGLFDNNYFMYLEDVDFSHRIKTAGLKLIVDPNIKIWHKVARGSGIGSSQNDYYITRNRLYFGFKFLSLRTKMALLREAIKNLFTGSIQKKKALIDFILQRMGRQNYL